MLADVWFNTSALLAAAWLGIVGYWVPLGIAALAAQFLYRNRSAPAESPPRLREDAPGKAAGVIYYLLVGAVALGIWLDAGRWSVWIGWTGNAVFVSVVHGVFGVHDLCESSSACAADFLPVPDETE